MEVEFIAEFTDPLSRDRARNIIKRKRTKRQRPCSTTSANSSDCLIDNIIPDLQSPVTSSEEDEDMANCLIMLAQSESPVKEDDKSDQNRRKTKQLTSRRFTEMTSPGLYAYQCKTCNRTFPSFQALGGHRASHKKSKVNVEDKKPSSVNIQPPLTEYSNGDNDVEEENKTSMFINNNVVKSPSPSPSPSPSTGFVQTANSKGKVHECSICGSEYSSGQALGGHMRKHRPVTASVNRLTESVAEKSTLSLDLNFPPPEVVDDVVQSKFQFTEGSSQQHMVFSAPALVGCHY